MYTRSLLNRREFLWISGIGLAAKLAPKSALAIDSNDLVYASAYKDITGSYGVALLTERGEILQQYTLPARGHGVVFSHFQRMLVTFARRPGTFAMAIDLKMKKSPIIFSTPKNRHFYGHGTFSADGQLVYTTENDFENSAGIIGIYNAALDFERIGEFQSFGIGPHELALLPDGRTLCIANGGIATHPDMGRTKLNIHRMEPSIAFIDTATGNLIEKHTLPPDLSRLSMRHVDIDGSGNIWIGCQYQGQQSSYVPLIAKVSVGEKMEILELPTAQMWMLKNYIGSVACNRENNTVAFTSPKGGVVLIIDTRTSKVISTHQEQRAGGLAASGKGFIVSSDRGIFAQTSHKLYWDNHIGLVG